MLDERQGRRGGVDEDGIIRFDPLCGKTSNGSFGVAVHLLALVEGELDPALIWANSSPMDAQEFAPSL